MSLTEMTQRGEEFERMPPHDVAAEQCVLGGMLLSKDAISDVIEVIRPTDHYRPAHQLVHEAILDLYARGEPADPITVSNELTRRGELARIGGAPYLHTLMAAVPTAANAGYYARIVRERAILRRLVEAGTRIVQFGYAGDADADDLVDRAQAEVYAVTDRRIAEDYHPLSEIMPAALEEIEAIGAHGGGISGVPTGFADLDSLTNGLHPGQMIVVAARPAVGKALALDTPLPTPDGWTTMGDVRVGDYLIDANGKPTQVVAATGVLHGRPCYEVEFSDGSVIIADENHQWQTWLQPDTWTRPNVVTTGEIAGSQPRHAIALNHTADLPPGTPQDTRWRFITDVRPVFPRPVRCVQVDNEDELYLAGRGMIPTHNSALALDFARSATIRHGLPTVVFSLEMGRNEITMRLAVGRGAGADAHHAHRADERRGLGTSRQADERGRGRAAVHRRLAEHVADGDPGQVPSAEAAARPQARDHRLPAAHVVAEADREPSAGSLGDVAVAEAAGEGTSGPGGRAVPAQPRPRTASGQEADAFRPA